MSQPTPAYRLPRQAVPTRYDLTFQPDLDAQTFRGEVRIAIDVLGPTKSLTLNAADLAISSASISHGSESDVAANISLDHENEQLTLSTDQEIPAGPATLCLTFSGVFNQTLCGVYPSTYKDEQGNTQVIECTHFEPTDARRAFPCWDEPEYKAVFGITLVVPQDLQAYSNAAERVSHASDTGMKRVEFHDTMKMSTYLVAFVVGRFVESRTVIANDIPMRVVSIPGREHLHDFALEVCDASMRYYAKYFEIPYPGGKMDMIAVPDFAHGAMENTGCVTYRETALLVDTKHATRPEIERVAEVVAHENAHMWFGNLVTMKWWNGIWLNEAFATFMAAMMADDFRPEWDTWTTFALSRNAAMNVDSMSSTRAIEYTVKHPSEARGMFDLLTYEKGCAILRMLEQYMGAEEFRRGMAAYLKEHAYKNTMNSDLWDALESTSKQPIRAMMDSWIFQGGYPIISAELGDDGKTLQLSQRRFRYLPDDDPTALWHVPISIRASIGNEMKHHKLLMTDGQLSLDLGATPDWLVINEQASGFYRVDYSDQLAEQLIRHIDKLHAVERLCLISDAWASCLANGTEFSQVLALVRVLANDNDPNVWATALAPLQLIETAIQPNVRSQFQEMVRDIARPKFAELGWSTSEDESIHAPILRGTLVATLGTLAADQEIIAAAQARYASYLTDRSAIDPDVVNAVEQVLATTNDEKWFEHFVQKFEDPTNTPQEQQAALRALASFTDAELTNRLLKLIEDERVRSQDAPFVVRMMLARATDPMPVWDWVESHWSMINDRYPENTIARIVDGTAYHLHAEYIDRVLAFMSTHPVPQAQKTVDQTCERLRTNKAFLEHNRNLLNDSFGT